MIVVSIDPGVRACGVAVWLDGKILAAAHVKSGVPKEARDATCWNGMAAAVLTYVGEVLETEGIEDGALHLVCEFPQTYGGKSAKGDTNDLLSLAAVVGAILTAFQMTDQTDVTLWRPHEWKGNLPKEVTRARVDDKLKPHEFARVTWPAPSLRHNVYDAIAIGQKFYETR